MAKKQSTDTGYFWTKPNGDRFAVVYYFEAGKRKKKTRAIPAGASKSKQYEILEELAGETKRKQPAPTGSTSKINGATLTWQQLFNWFTENYARPAVFNSDDKLIGGCLTAKDRRLKAQFFVDRFGAGNRVRDLTSLDIQNLKEQRLAEPVITRQKKRDPNDPNPRHFLKDKKGQPIWITTSRPREIGGVHRELGLLCKLLHLAHANNWIPVNPWRKDFINPADEKKRETIVTQAEEFSLLDQCGADKDRRHFWLYLTVLFDCALRSAELRRLRVRHIDFEKNEFVVYSFKGGRRTERPVPMTPRARLALLESCYPDKLNPELPAKTPDDYAITHNKFYKTLADGSKQIEYRQLKQAPRNSWATAKRLARWWSDDQINLTGVRLHDVRHTAITRLQSTGAPIAEIMKWSGHAQMATFMRYVNPDHTSRAALANALHNYHEAAVVQLADHKAKAKSA